MIEANQRMRCLFYLNTSAIVRLAGIFLQPERRHNRKFIAWFGLRKIERSEYANQATR